jgi:hypothetical protein
MIKSCSKGSGDHDKITKNFVHILFNKAEIIVNYVENRQNNTKSSSKEE